MLHRLRFTVPLALAVLLPHCAPKETGSCAGTLDGAAVSFPIDTSFSKYFWGNPPCGPRSVGNCPRNIIRNASVYFTVNSTRVVGFSVISPQDIADVTSPVSLTASGAMLESSPFAPDEHFETAGLSVSDSSGAGGGHWSASQPLTNITATTTRWDANSWDGTLDLTYGADRLQCTFSVERER